jgi:DNA-binding response OmpR family regulator
MAKILVIEDDESVQHFLTCVLTRMNHKSIITSDGNKAAELAKDETIDLILTDLTLPGSLSGIDLIRKLRATRPKCPIVVISGYPSSEKLKECKELGIGDFLTKPFEIGFLHSVIERIFSNPTDLTNRQKPA